MKLLLEFVDKEIGKLEIIVQRSLLSAQEIAKAAAASPSMSGDREHAVNQAVINEEKLNNLRALREEVLGSLGKQFPKAAKPACYISVESTDGSRDEYYFLLKSAYLTGYKFISPESPFGQAILGKKEGDQFSYELDREGKKESFSGKIISIE